LLRAFERGEPALVRHPRAVRPWQHVLEPLAGYLALAERLYRDGERFTGAWNFGPLADDIRPVRDIASALAAAVGGGASFEIREDATAPHEAGLLLLDATKARTQLHWDTLLKLDEALGWIADWQRGVRAGTSARTVTIAQIERYEARIGAAAAALAATAAQTEG
jgi:CDP-glucose 4,6-dehydratase